MAGSLDSSPSGSPSGSEPSHPGERFGLPASGVGAVAGFGRRLAGVTVDWLLAYALTLAVLGLDALGGPTIGWWVWAVWAVLTALPTAVFGMTPGMVALGIRVARVDMAAVVGFRAVARTILLGLVIPAVIRDEDGRGWHDRASATIVIRSRP
jgi:uncharacterized RDD family membrane protein YckC